MASEQRTCGPSGEAVDAFVAEREDELVQLVRTLVGFETVSVDLSPGSEHRENQEGELQAFVAERLGALGARVDRSSPTRRRSPTTR